MLPLIGIPARAWLNRKNTDTPVRRQARAAVAGQLPAVVITGGSRGIGLAIAQTFLANGHDVFIIARDQTALDTTSEALNREHDGRCRVVSLDVTSNDAPDRIQAELKRTGHYLDILVNNAGLGVSGRFENTSSTKVDAVIALNIAALTRLTRTALPDMLARGRGGIINLASLGGYIPGPYQAAYYASKAYVLSLSEAVAAEISGRGVVICTVAPGPVDTRFHADMGAQDAIYRRFLPNLTADDVAAAAHRGFTNGQRVVVPGLHYRLAFMALRLLPHFISVPLTALLLKNPRP